MPSALQTSAEQRRFRPRQTAVTPHPLGRGGQGQQITHSNRQSLGKIKPQAPKMCQKLPTSTKNGRLGSCSAGFQSPPVVAIGISATLVLVMAGTSRAASQQHQQEPSGKRQEASHWFHISPASDKGKISSKNLLALSHVVLQRCDQRCPQGSPQFQGSRVLRELGGDRKMRTPLGSYRGKTHPTFNSSFIPLMQSKSQWPDQKQKHSDWRQSGSSLTPSRGPSSSPDR